MTSPSPAAAPARSGMRILYVVSLFPCWSETFIVREMTQMIARGADLRILSLRHASETVVQSDAAQLLDRVIYPPSAGRSLAGALRAVATHPVSELAGLARLAAGLWRHPEVLAKSLLVWWRTLGAADAIRAWGPTHIHAHFATYPSTAALALSRRLDVPFSFTAHAHDIFLEDHLLALKMRSAKFSVAISEFNRRFLGERLGEGATRNTRIVHCGVSLAAFPFCAEGRDPRRILAVGRLDEIKGFPHLVEACARLKARGVAFACDIVGSGPLEGLLKERIAALGLQESVRLLGMRKQEEVRALMQQAGIFALPSVVTRRGDRDGIPVALMEAMASGTPVVSTRVSGIPELVQDGVNGLLAAPADADALCACLERLLEDPSLAAALAVRARATVEREFEIGRESGKLYDAIASAA